MELRIRRKFHFTVEHDSEKYSETEIARLELNSNLFGKLINSICGEKVVYRKGCTKNLEIRVKRSEERRINELDGDALIKRNPVSLLKNVVGYLTNHRLTEKLSPWLD